MTSANLTTAYVILPVYIVLVLGLGIVGAFRQWRAVKQPGNSADATAKGGLLREHFMAGLGLGFVSWFFSMAASLFSGYSVNGIVNEAYSTGWLATRWIPAGVGLYGGFMVLAPRCYALGKERGYMTMSELIFDRYLPPRGNKWVAHGLRLLSFAFLQLPIFTYLITQFQSVGIETQVFTQGHISSTTAVLVAAAVLLICDLLGGMRAVAFTDVLQGAVLFLGSIIFLIIQRTELGGLPRAFDYWSDPANLAQPRVAGMQLLPTKPQVVNYFDFVFKTAVAATMFPHLATRMFCARSADVMRKGLAGMNFTFFVVQLSSMITGWVAINALLGYIKPGQSAFGTTLLHVAEGGAGQALASSLLLGSCLCALMSTADSALLAFSTMWVRDLFKPYLYQGASETVQLLFGKLMALIALVIGVTLSILSINRGKPDLTSLFSLQAVTPIHVAPAVWFGLHWRNLRGEAVLAGMVSGGAVTLGLVFSDKNIKLSIGSDQLDNGLSSAWVGFCVNVFVTVVLGLAYQYGPSLLQRAAGRQPSSPGSSNSGAAQEGDEEVDPASLDIGPEHDGMLRPWLGVLLVLLLLFTIPFYWPDLPLGHNKWVGNMAAWAFTSLFLSGIMAIVYAAVYLVAWKDYTPLARPDLPCHTPSPTNELAMDPKVLNKDASSPIQG